MKIISILLIGSLVLVSCSNNTFIKKLPIHQKYEKEINYLGKDRSGIIVFRNNTELPVEEIRLVTDSLYYKETLQSRHSALALNDIKEIKFKDHTAGIFQGLLLGLGMGVATGYISIDWDTEMAGLGMILYGGIGILIGGIYGGISGSDLNYIFLNQEE